MERFWVSEIKEEETYALFPDVPRRQGIHSLQTSCVSYRYLDFSPSSNILDVSILNIVNEPFLRGLLVKGFLVGECHHEGGFADPKVTKHDKVENVKVFHL